MNFRQFIARFSFSEEHETRMDSHGVVAAYWDLEQKLMTILKWSKEGKREAKSKVEFTIDLREKQVHMTKVN